MNFGIGLVVLAVLGTGVIVLWMALGSKFADWREEAPTLPVLPSDAELNKLTKSKLEELAREFGVELDKKKTKANMISDLKGAV